MMLGSFGVLAGAYLDGKRPSWPAVYTMIAVMVPIAAHAWILGLLDWLV